MTEDDETGVVKQMAGVGYLHNSLFGQQGALGGLQNAAYNAQNWLQHGGFTGGGGGGVSTAYPHQLMMFEGAHQCQKCGIHLETIRKLLDQVQTLTKQIHSLSTTTSETHENPYLLGNSMVRSKK